MDTELGTILLTLARNAIAKEFGIKTDTPSPDHPNLAQPGATFVTLTQSGRLRGCIGSLAAWRPLLEDVQANARAAAFKDPRFPMLAADELPRARVEVSLLTTAEPMTFTDENDALRQLRPEIDGVIFESGMHRSTFLPQVWESLPEPRQFLAQLKLKAGLPPNYWHKDVKLSRYQVQKWKEQEVS